MHEFETLADAFKRVREMADAREGQPSAEASDKGGRGTLHVSSQAHREEMLADFEDPTRKEVHDAWFREDTVDFWRHRRMYEPVFDCLRSTMDKKWLTVGDGRYGLDAIRMRRRGFRDVLPTDISDNLLKVAMERGLIDNFRLENAERLSFEDDSFDYVLCKEAYHHFPRPMVALHEMLRVAREAVVLIEPQDGGIDSPVVPGTQVVMYEPSGNYIYTVSRRELEKVCLGMSLPALSFKGLNDHFVANCHRETCDESSPTFREIRRVIAERDARCAQGLEKERLLMAVLFKRGPSETVRRDFAAKGWAVENLPDNPHWAKLRGTL